MTSTKLFILGFIALILFILREPIRDTYRAYTLDVGQVWIYKAYRKNPFSTSVERRQRIIAVSENYVQYVENEIDTLSCSKRWFLLGSERVK